MQAKEGCPLDFLGIDGRTSGPVRKSAYSVLIL